MVRGTDFPIIPIANKIGSAALLKVNRRDIITVQKE